MHHNAPHLQHVHYLVGEGEAEALRASMPPAEGASDSGAQLPTYLLPSLHNKGCRWRRSCVSGSVHGCCLMELLQAWLRVATATLASLDCEGGRGTA